MLFCGANAVGYTNYPNNVVQRFYKKASKYGVDIFRVDSLNCIDTLNLGVDAESSDGGFAKDTLYYTGCVSVP